MQAATKKYVDDNSPVIDGSITDEKLSNTAGQIKDVVNAHLAEYVHVTNYGAVGDGLEASATANTTAIQNAINAVNASGGGVVFFPGQSAVYYVNGDIIPKSNVILVGASKNTAIKLKSGFSGKADLTQRIPPIFKQATGSGTYIYNVGVKNITLDGNRANQTIIDNYEWSHGLELPYVDGLKIEDVYFKNFQGDGFFVGNSIDWDVNAVPCYKIHVNNCDFDNFHREGIGLFHVDGAYVNNCRFFNSSPDVAGIDCESHNDADINKNIKIENCTFDFTENHRGISILGDATTTGNKLNRMNVTLFNNTFLNAFVDIYSYNRVKILYNKFYISDSHTSWTNTVLGTLNIYAAIFGQNVNSQAYGVHANLELTGNEIILNNNLSTGIKIFDIAEVDITRNVIKNSTEEGISLTNTLNSAIVNNGIFDCGQTSDTTSAGIYLGYDCANIKVTGNHVRDTNSGGSRVMCYGIRIIGTNSSAGIIAFNEIFNTKTSDILDEPTQPSFHKNIYNFTDYANNMFISLSGNTASRPTVHRTGQFYYDNTIGKPIWWSGAAWKDAAGNTV